MEDIVQLLKIIQSDINETKNSVINSEINLLKKLDDKFNEAQIKLSILESKTQEQENRIDYLEKQIRSRNIVIFGVEETEKTYEELRKIVLDIFNTKMKISCTSLEIEFVRRKGKKCEKTRPIIITLTTFGRKIEALRHRKLVEKYNYYIKEDYPPKVLMKRKQLQEQIKKERENGNKTFIKYDKLIIIPKKDNQLQEKSRNKPNLSTSSPVSQNINKGNKTHLQQKHVLQSYWTPKQTPKKSTTKESFFSPNPEPLSQNT